MTTHADGIFQYGGMPVTGGVPPFVSRYSKTFFVDPVNGLDGNKGTSPKLALKSLYRAHSLMTAGQNDVCYLIGAGTSAGFSILSAANAAAGDTSLTVGTLVWSKAACHLIGISAPGVGQRASIRAPQTTYTGGSGGTFGADAFITVSANGCYFSNLSIMNDFTTGGAGEILVTVTGSYNVFDRVSMYGFGNSASAGGTASRTLKVGGGGENYFYGCQLE